MRTDAVTDIVLVRPRLNLRYNYCRLADTLSLGYLAAVLKKNGFRVATLDGLITGQSTRETAARILELQPKVVGLTVMLQRLPETLVNLAKLVKAADPDVVTVVGGHYPTLCYEEILRNVPEIDCVIRHEGEFALLEFMKRVVSGDELHASPNLAYRVSGDRIGVNPSLPLIADLDALPFPDKSVIPGALRKNMLLTMATSRGCYERCSFCSIAQFQREPPGKVWRARSPENVAEEIRKLQGEFGIGHIMFIDDNFIGPGSRGAERCYDLAGEIRRRGVKIEWAISTRADNVEKDLFRAMKEAGLRHVFLGIESFVKETLDYHAKRILPEANLKAIRTLKSLGISIQPGFILFDPYVTIEQIAKNVSALKDLGLANMLTLDTELSVYGGTPIEKKLRNDNLLHTSRMTRSYSIPCPKVRLARKAVRGASDIYVPYPSLIFKYARPITFKWREKGYNLGVRDRAAKIRALKAFETALDDLTADFVLGEIGKIRRLDLSRPGREKAYLKSLDRNLALLSRRLEKEKRMALRRMEGG